MLFLYSLLISTVNSVSIDNDIIGEPDIECMDDRIRVWIKTRKIFTGRIYAKGKAESEDCYKDDFQKERTKKPMFDLSFVRGCGMRSLRSVDPRGMYYGVTIVVSFHPLFITKVDQAFHVKCFFEEANRGLTAELGVSMIPTTEVEARHGIPGCSYTIHKSSIQEIDAGNPAGSSIQFARVGDKVLHQWHCNDQMFGILINNCYVTDGFGKKAEVIDNNGCPVDPILITGIRYSKDMQRAYAESQVFKFADKPGVWFFCQIQMCMKKAGMCKGITPPSCASIAPDSSDVEDGDFPQPGAVGRGRFGGKKNNLDYENSIDSDGDYDLNTQRIARPKGKKRPKNKYPTGPPDYGESDDFGGAANAGDYDSSPAKFHGSDSGGGAYALPPTTPGNDFQFDTEATTLFGPPVSLNKKHTKATTIDTVTVTETFETNDDLQNFGTTQKGTTKHDYNDYEDVTIPPNLTDLLANLPDDINADSLQKMFRDSVIDRKTLLESMDMLKKEMMKENAHVLNSHARRVGRSGEKVDQIQVDWTSARNRDQPLPMSVEKREALSRLSDLERTLKIIGKNETEDETMKVRRETTKKDDPKEAKPQISGQLIIYELDEEPPMEAAQKSMAECGLSHSILLWSSASFGGLSVALFILLLIVSVKYLRLSRAKDVSFSSPRRHLTAHEVFSRNRSN
ncbi:unnamed protein product, partial [Mesorhabditis belari]|uniref:ZP domain-containing protein n=1 Tax=Mesorhabditis belari TaxID=2138241 RepID=A0AAF3EVG2_9BILA